MAPEWVDFLVMTGAFLLVATGGLIWMFFFRKTRRRRHKHRHHHDSRPSKISRSPKSGRPPMPQDETSSGLPPTTSRP
jgi:hypothetical protein